MITTVTLNPAIDKTITTSSLLSGQVNRSESVKNIAGGKGINVTKVLRQYGNSVCALGFLGGYTGRFIEEYVEGLGAESFFTRIAGETRTSINVLSGDGYVTEILEPGPVITEEEKEQFLQTYRKKIAGSEFVVLSGSAPKGLPTDIYAQLIALADEQKIRTVLDTNGELLVEGVKAKPFLIKPNTKELEYLTGRKLREGSEIKEAALQLASEGIAHVLVSMGEKGMLYATEGKCLFAKAPKVKALNTVGSGDSAVAAAVMALQQGTSMEDTLRLCVAISAANTTTLENAVIPKEYAAELLIQIQVTEL
jgi:tagatose 6-phosphate kinase